MDVRGGEHHRSDRLRAGCVGLFTMRRTTVGLTLIELLVVLAVLAIFATGVFSLYVSGVLASSHAQQLAAATVQAQARLETIRSNPNVLQHERVRPETLVGGPDYRERIDAVPIAPGLDQVTATVFWMWRGRERQTSLTTVVRTP